MSDNMKYTLLLLGCLLLGGVLIWELADTLLEAAVIDSHMTMRSWSCGSALPTHVNYMRVKRLNRPIRTE